MELNPVDVQKHLHGASYPASREDLVLKGEQNGAPEELLRELRGLSEEEFTGPDRLMSALRDGR